MSAPAAARLLRIDSPDPRIKHGLLLLLLMAIPSVHPSLNRWPVAQFAPVAVYLALVFAIPSLRRTASWLRRGRLSRPAILASVCLAACVSGALLGWAFIAHPDFHRFDARIPSTSGMTLAGVGIAFALANASAEEVVWRGALLDALESRIGAVGAIVAQGLAFGAGHYAGIPGGIAGVVLATLYGLALGWLRRVADGLLLCILVHVCADATIFLLVAQSIHR